MPVKVELQAWNQGFLAVRAIQLFMRSSGLGLRASKAIVDDFVNGTPQVVIFNSCQAADQFVRAFADLHGIATIVQE